MYNRTERSRTTLLASPTNTYDLPDSPMWFGPDGQQPQKTYITDEPLGVTEADFKKLVKLAQKTADYIASYPLQDRALELGTDPRYLDDCLRWDGKNVNKLYYGGLDVYFDPENAPKILEINSRVQAMGLQDTRQDHLGIIGQPRMIDHFVNLLKSEGYDRVLILGSRVNPFWRSHAKMAKVINEVGIECYHHGTETLEKDWQQKLKPQAIVKLTSSKHIVYDDQSARLREAISKHEPRFINSLSSTFYGDRGFLYQIAQDLPEFFPRQRVLADDVTEDEMMDFPWLKLEAGREFAYVANFREFRRWGKDAIKSLVQRNYGSFKVAIDGKNNGDAMKLQAVKEAVSPLPEEQIRWVAQEDIRPLKTKLSFQGQGIEMAVLHRVYWVQNVKGGIDVSIEGFGCTEDQLSRSKGKINAGSGIAIPMVIV